MAQQVDTKYVVFRTANYDREMAPDKRDAFEADVTAAITRGDLPLHSSLAEARGSGQYAGCTSCVAIPVVDVNGTLEARFDEIAILNVPQTTK